MRVSSYLISAPIRSQPFSILLHGLTGALDKVPIAVGNALLENRGKPCPVGIAELLGPGALAHLRSRGYLTDLSHAEERSALIDIAKALHQTDLAMAPTNFMIIPTYRCNLRCPYCFQSHDLHAGKGRFVTVMDEAMADAAFATMDGLRTRGAAPRAAGFVEGSLPDLPASPRRIGLFGGEPLCAETVPIIGHIAQLAARRGDSLSATTNGVQLELFAELLGRGAGRIEEVQITLDGPRSAHDKRRVGPDFARTFDRIAENVDLALADGVQVALRLNIDSANPHAVEDLDGFFDDRGWTKHPLFMAYAAVVHDVGPRDPVLRSAEVPDAGAAGVRKHAKRYRAGTLGEAELAALAAELRARPGGSSISSYDRYAKDVIRSCLRGDPYPFKQGGNCSAEVGLLMFDCFGDVYSCWEEAGHRERRIGTYDECGLRFDRDIAAQWFARFPGAIEQCSDCPYALIHSSGCAKHALDQAGTTLAAACESFQVYFPPTLAESWRSAEEQILSTAPRP
jgi:uncharacterized protein